MRAAVTGGTGFLGAALIDKLLKEGWNVAALARDPRRVKNDSVDIVEGDLENETALEKLASNADVFFHLAGVTHAHDAAEYERVNVAGAERAAAAAAHADARLVHISSLTARKPDVSPYGKSKFDSEGAVAQKAGAAPWCALRLPAIYGPGDFVTLPYFKLVKSGFALEPQTAAPASASLVFVEDAAAAMIAAAQNAPTGAVYEVGDDAPEGREWREIGQILGEAMGKNPRRIRVPRPLISAYHGVLRGVERGLGKPPSVRAGQVNEFFHPDWVARDNLLADVSSWRATTPLKEGFAKTVRWYQVHGFL